MLFGGFGCEPGYENCGYDQESYVTYVDTRGATTYQNEKLRRVFKFILWARFVTFMDLSPHFDWSTQPSSKYVFENSSQSNGPMGNDK